MLILGVFAMISNYLTEDCVQIQANCSLYWYNLVSIPNKILHENAYFIQTWVNLFTIICIMVSLHVFRRIQRLSEKECDRGLISPSDYAIWLKLPPKRRYSQQDIEKLLGESLRKFNVDSKIKKVVLAYDIIEFMANCRKLNEIETKILKGKEYVDCKGKWPEGNSEQEMEEEKDGLNGKIQAFIKETEADEEKMLGKTSGHVFVVFEDQNSNLLLVFLGNFKGNLLF